MRQAQCLRGGTVLPLNIDGRVLPTPCSTRYLVGSPDTVTVAGARGWLAGKLAGQAVERVAVGHSKRKITMAMLRRTFPQVWLTN